MEDGARKAHPPRVLSSPTYEGLGARPRGLVDISTLGGEMGVREREMEMRQFT